jgi:RNA polymerase sigma factor (sigma-70 family)
MSNGHRRERVKAWLSTLEDNERDILKYRYGLGGDPETLEKIGRRFGVTRERIRQIETRALRKLKELGQTENIDSLEAI